MNSVRVGSRFLPHGNKYTIFDASTIAMGMTELWAFLFPGCALILGGPGMHLALG